MRNHAYRRAVRSRWINRRLFIVQNIWREEPWPWLKGGGKLAKYNFAHGQCGLDSEKYRYTRHLQLDRWTHLSLDTAR